MSSCSTRRQTTSTSKPSNYWNSGTLLLVSHDRSFLNNVVTSTIALEGYGQIEENIGGCEVWLEKHEARTAERNKAKPKSAPSPEASTPAAPKRTLSNKEREAVKTLPGKIEQMEAELEKLSTLMASADYYQDAKSDLTGDAKKLESLEEQILQSYEQLEELEALAN